MYKRKRVESQSCPSTPSKKIITKIENFTSQAKDFINSINKPQSHVEKAQAEIKKRVLSNEEAYTYRIAEKQLATMGNWQTVPFGLPHRPKTKPVNTPPAWLGAEGFEGLTKKYLANTSQDQEKHKECLEQEKKLLADLPPDYKTIFPMKYDSSDAESDDEAPRGGQRFYTENDLLKLLRLRGSSFHEKSPGGVLFTNVRTKHDKIQSEERSLRQKLSLEDITRVCVNFNLDDNDQYDPREVKRIGREVKHNMVVDGMNKYQVKLAGIYLCDAIHLYFNNRDDGPNDEMVLATLEMVRKFAGGKTRQWSHKDRPLVDMHNFEGFEDLLAFEARCCCWASHQMDVEVGEEVLKLIAQAVGILEGREEDDTSGDDSSKEEDFDDSPETGVQDTPEEDFDSSFTIEEGLSEDDYESTLDFEEIDGVQQDSPSERFTSRANFESSPPSLPGFRTLFPRRRVDDDCFSTKGANVGDDDDEVASNFSGFETVEGNSDDELEDIF